MIRVEGLSKRFGEVTAISDVTFSVDDGEIFGLLGPNGAGKTTTIRMLAGLIAPTSGTAVINGHRLGPDSQRIRAISGFLTESPGLHEKLTGRQNLAYYARLYGLDGDRQRAAVDRYLEIVGLDGASERKVSGYSKGMRQKIAIARALLHEPEVIYLDEPTSALDPGASKMVRDFISSLRSAGRTIVLCTHNLDEAERLCDRIGIVHGRLLQIDTPAALRRNGSATVRVDLVEVTADLLGVLQRLPFVTGCRQDGDSLEVEVVNPDAEVPKLARALVNAGAELRSLRQEAATLEDVYLDMVGDGTAER